MMQSRSRYLRGAMLALLLCVGMATGAQARKGDPDVPTRKGTTPVVHVGGLTIQSPCAVCEESNGHAAGSCMLCRVVRRFAALGGW